MRDIDKLSVLIISDVMSKCNSSATAMEGIMEDLNDSDIDVIYEHEPEGIFGCTRIMSAGMDAVVVDWSMPDDQANVTKRCSARRLRRLLRHRQTI